MEGKVVWSVADAIINNQQVDYPPPLVARNTDYSVNTSTWEYGDEYYIQDGLFYIKNPTTKTYNLSNQSEATEMLNHYAVCTEIISGESPRTQLWQLNSRSGNQYITYSSNSYGYLVYEFAYQDYYYTVTKPVSGYVTLNSNTDYPNNDWKNNKYYIKVHDLT